MAMTPREALHRVSAMLSTTPKPNWPPEAEATALN